MVTENSIGGDLFEIEERIRISVYDTRRKKRVLHFRGEHYGEWSKSGTGWEYLGTEGVMEAELEPDGVTVKYADGGTRRYRLPRRKLSKDEILALVAAHGAWDTARQTYEYEETWSSDVAIPQAAIQASYEAAQARWSELVALLEELELRTVPAHDLEWPYRIPGGKASAAPLREWLEAGGHLCERSSVC